MSRLKESAGLLGLIGALLVGGFLIKLAIASLVGLLVWLAFGFNWLVSAIIAWFALTLILGVAELFETPDHKQDAGGPCPYCGKRLRTIKAQQCRHCGKKWHGMSP